MIIGVAGGSYLAYKIYMPDVIAVAITSNELPSYLPETIKKKVKKIKKPVNDGANAIISTMHKSNVTLAQVLEAIDNVSEEEAHAMLDSLNTIQIQNTEQVFNMAKRQFPVDFDVEVFRKPYKEKVNMRLIKKGIAYANRYKGNEEMDFESARSILKSILINKEKEFNKIVND
jgi:hypothetical protein